MLEPYSRNLLLELLRPPEDYRLDAGIGTTYSLDLLALLTAPFAFACYGAADPEGLPKANSLEILNGLHQYANRLTIFCQEGRIIVPRARYPQLAYLERSVVECRAPRGGSFHPKIWVLRFERSSDDVIYRMLCLSRNLTFDRSWDTVLTLEGPLLDRKNAIARNNPLGDFVRALPGTAARRPVASTVADRIDRLGTEIRRVDFAVPEGFDECRFWPIGVGDSRPRSPFGETGTRMLVISPFLAKGRLASLANGRRDNLLVSTEASLRAVGGKPDGYLQAYVLNEDAKPEAGSDAEGEVDDIDVERAPGDLHAKCYVADAGGAAHVWTGSANATEAAFERNVEFLVELVGPKRLFGIDTLMVRQKDTLRFVDVLQEADDLPPDEVDKVEEQLTSLLDLGRAALLEAGLHVVVQQGANGGFDLELRVTSTRLLEKGVSALAWPITLPRDIHQRTVAAESELAATFPAVSFEALTTFYAFELTAAAEGRVRREPFVLNLPTEGLPQDRAERLLRMMVKDRNRFMQFLRLLLGDAGQSWGIAGGHSVNRTNAGMAQWFLGQEPVLESLVKALDRYPERLDQVARLVAEVAQSDQGAELLPPGFNEIWEPIYAARQRMLNGHTRPSA